MYIMAELLVASGFGDGGGRGFGSKIIIELRQPYIPIVIVVVEVMEKRWCS